MGINSTCIKKYTCRYNPLPQGADTKRMGEAGKEELGLGGERKGGTEGGPGGSLDLAQRVLGLERGLSQVEPRLGRRL